jgi:hypothetical protein
MVKWVLAVCLIVALLLVSLYALSPQDRDRLVDEAEVREAEVRLKIRQMKGQDASDEEANLLLKRAKRDAKETVRDIFSVEIKDDGFVNSYRQIIASTLLTRRLDRFFDRTLDAIGGRGGKTSTRIVAKMFLFVSILLAVVAVPLRLVMS